MNGPALFPGEDYHNRKLSLPCPMDHELINRRTHADSRCARHAECTLIQTVYCKDAGLALTVQMDDFNEITVDKSKDYLVSWLDMDVVHS